MPKKSGKTSSQGALAYAESIIATLRDPFVVLDKSSRVRSANAAFYRDFHASKEETEGRFIYDLGSGQWDIPQLRTLLGQVVSNVHAVEDFEVAGVGIAPEILPRIFDLFTQAKQSLDRSQGGLGIGLALVQRLVKLHGGIVEATSTVGQGSEFVVRLPVIPPPERQSVLHPAEKAEQLRPSLRVLVVDDNVDTVTTLAMLVRESGYDVRTAYDGSTVLEAVLDYRPNVVLLDIGLPGMNGYEVAKQIRQQPALKNSVLVAMTGYGQESDRKSSHDAGFDYHLVKPADFPKVLRILATVSESFRKRTRLA